VRWGALDPAPPPAPAAPAEDPLRRAAAEAAALLQRARQEAEDLRAEARRSGWEEGFATGRAAAEAAAAEMLRAARVERTRARAERRAAFRALEWDLAALAMEMASRVLQRELETAPEEVVALARRLVQRTEGPVRLRVHPDLAPVLWAEQASLPRPVDVVPDAEVDRGGVVLEGEDGVLDASVSGRLSRVAAALEEAGPRGL
jgi:flagellar assembly protein FliH